MAQRPRTQSTPTATKSSANWHRGAGSRRRIAGRPTRPAATLRRANGNRDGANRDFGEAIRLDPRMVGPYVQRGGMFRERGAHDKALDDFTLAIRNASENP